MKINQKWLILAVVFITLNATAQGRTQLSTREFSINGFRNPSVGLEYRYQFVSVHAGYYPTIVSENAEGDSETTSFIRAGASLWFLPVRLNKQEPSSFYTSLSYLRGLDMDYRDENALLAEGGFKWMVWKGLNIRLGVAALIADGHSVKINPTPGISWSFFPGRK